MFEQIIVMLKQIAEDRTVPHNIRDKVNESIKILQNEQEEVKVRAGTVTATLDEVSNDVNIPMYTRTQIWNIVTALEAVQKEEHK